jgi:outer membrane autotransporter protein
MGDFVESGPGGISFAVLDSQETLWSIAPALEVGMDREIRGGAVLRPWLRAGAAVRPDGEFGVPARFTGAPAGVDPFTVTSTIDEVMLTLNAGVDVLNLNNMSVSIGYEGEFGEEHQRQGGKVKVGLKF